MNPMLPPYGVRGPPPFDSMDLSLQSSRNSSSPLNKSGMSHGMPSMHDYGNLKHHNAASQQQMHSASSYPM